MSSANVATEARLELATLNMGGLLIAVPLSEVQTLDPVLDVVYEEARSPSIGYIVAGDNRLPVFALDSELEPLSAPPQNHRICALLGQGAPWLGLVCDAVTTLNRTTYEESPVPACMRTAESPISHLLVQDDKVICATNIEELVRYLELPEFNDVSDADAVDLDGQ